MSNKIIIAAGKHANFVRRDNWEYVERPKISGIVVIVPVTDDNKLILIEQFRVPVQKNVIELPAGLAGDIAGTENEPLAAAAKRELLEETGYEAREMTYLTEGASSAGITDEILAVFRATRLKKIGDPEGDGDEHITVHAIPLAEVPAWLVKQREEGKVIDLKVYAGLYFANGK
jgi:ADP-ribose pyrophosphatase